MADTITVEGVIVPIGSHIDKLIVIGADARGFDYKNHIADKLHARGFRIKDVSHSVPDQCEYPTVSYRIGFEVSMNPYHRVGIGVSGTGSDILIVAAKLRGVYAARCLSPDDAVTSRAHNNTNMLGIGSECADLESTLATVDAWLTTPFYADVEQDGIYLRHYIHMVRLEGRMR